MEYSKHYVPLESDPLVFTNLMRDLGVDGPFTFVDIWSIEADQLPAVRLETQQPINALILILPDCPAYTEKSVENTHVQDGVVWLRQTINNACGLYAILHCVCNMIAPQFISKSPLEELIIINMNRERLIPG